MIFLDLIYILGKQIKVSRDITKLDRHLIWRSLYNGRLVAIKRSLTSETCRIIFSFISVPQYQVRLYFDINYLSDKNIHKSLMQLKKEFLQDNES